MKRVPMILLWLISFALFSFPSAVQARIVPQILAPIVARAGQLVDDVARWLSRAPAMADDLADDAARLVKKAPQVADDLVDDLARGVRRPGLLARRLPKGTPLPPRVAAAAGRVLQKIGPAFADEAVRLAVTFGDEGALLMERMGARGLYYLKMHGSTIGPAWQAALRQGQDAGFIRVLTTYGDRFVRYLEQHKALAAGGLALTAVLANPEPYLMAGDRMVRTVSQEVVKPVLVTTVPRTVEKGLEVAGTVGLGLVDRLLAVFGRNGILAMLLGLLFVRWGWPALQAAVGGLIAAWREPPPVGPVAQPAKIVAAVPVEERAPPPSAQASHPAHGYHEDGARKFTSEPSLNSNGPSVVRCDQEELPEKKEEI